MLSIGLILPDILGTYGDSGNALILRQRARLRGINAKVVSISLGEAIPDSLDIYCIGGGEDTAQLLAVEKLADTHGLKRAAAQQTPILAICAGFQILGESFRAGGRIADGLGLIDATTVSLETRAIGEVRSQPTGAGVTAELNQPLTGFENHLGATLLGADAQPLGTVTFGQGNCDAAAAAEFLDHDRQITAEGAVQGSIISTYMHGPVLARNPQLADLLLSQAMGISLSELEPLDLPIIERLRQERLASTK
ncbi:putative glutamine amidotransferase [Corynebacterium kutscheri]|uniref:Lipid II isoglutaminyl synthase (glutamine-hydrolyzing) subunit GatD n=1 Tax=Corynebacterium kutscheri TaxID=35755 RepID=A0A0F6R0F7_9CORY|nr:glutamine amidotransferase [Corynebacterium kutscheri]AKE40383.1 putative glutamine amidotransferase [Corynebacterium kutscheri]VEH10778.1 cobyric acid synthase [Corynebacterium kutscheri]